jgi:2-oxo-3-hexenedioate decarboxylase
MPQPDVLALAHEMLDALANASLVVPPAERYPDIDFPTAYRVAAEETRLRQKRGEQPVGRKIGYTNRNIWAQYNVHQPIWGHVYAHTVHHPRDNAAEMSLARMVAPRIEPEIAFKLRSPLPARSADPEVVLRSVEWVARTFEIVDCHYADWKFSGPDSVIDFSHHAALIVGEPREVAERDIPHLVSALRDCRVMLFKDDALADSGVGSNALDHPALALALLANLVDSQPEAVPVEAGEIVTTGTLTAALPVRPGETWRTETGGLPLPPLTVRFV